MQQARMREGAETRQIDLEICCGEERDGEFNNYREGRQLLVVGWNQQPSRVRERGQQPAVWETARKKQDGRNGAID
jgi:hypothetical protein